MCCGRVLRDIPVGDDPAQHALPRMAVTVDKAGNQNRIRGVDDLPSRQAGRLYVGSYGLDLRTASENVALNEVTHGRVQANDRATLEQKTMTGIEIGLRQPGVSSLTTK